jgi:hypothetical protein
LIKACPKKPQKGIGRRRKRRDIEEKIKKFMIESTGFFRINRS